MAERPRTSTLMWTPEGKFITSLAPIVILDKGNESNDPMPVSSHEIDSPSNLNLPIALGKGIRAYT